VVDVQALAGDPTDNVPGVPGIGIKTAAQLVLEYGSVEALLDNAEKIKQPKRREALLNNREQALVSKKLVQLDADAPLPAPIETLEARPPERASLESFLRAQGFRSIIARMGLGEAAGDAGTRARHSAVAAHQAAAGVPAADAPRPPGEAPYGPYETVTDMAALRRWIAEPSSAGVVGFDTETDSLDALRANLVGLSLATAPGRACYVPLRHGKAGDMLAEKPPQLDPAEALEALRPLLTDPGTLKVLQNAKYDLEVLARPENGGIAVDPVDDTMLISYSMDAGRHGHGMDELAGAPPRPQAHLLRRGDGHRPRPRPLRRGAARPRHRLRRRGRGRDAPPPPPAAPAAARRRCAGAL
jgi:DNA polymerase-1